MVFPKDWNMNTLSKLSPFIVALLLVACNEKVSPELQGAGSVSTTGGSSSGGSTVVPDEYYFRVVNKADTMLNFKVHKTGEGNANKNCEITSATAFTSDGYRSDPATYDITCYYEAEELSLNFNGISYGLEVSPNSCPFIGYSPFSYYNYQPGDSSQEIDHLVCDDIVTAGEASTAEPAIGNSTCNSYRSKEAGSVDGIIESEDTFCNFNYTIHDDAPADAPNCDTGIIKINEYVASKLDLDANGVPETVKVNQTLRTISCGGKAANCIEGPIKLTTLSPKYTNGLIVSKTVLNKSFTTQWDLPALFGIYSSNRRYVNYRRDLASTQIEYGDSNRLYNDSNPNNDTTLSSAYLSSFGDPLYKYSFEPNVMSNYSNNKRMNGTELVTSAMIEDRIYDYWGSRSGNLTAGRPLAAEPFIGFGSNKTNAYYTFYCLDNALDIRARVRMVVRDWDRVLSSSPTDVSFARISDVDLLPPFARQDVPYTVEVTGDTDSWNDFNDFFDWDDTLDMQRDDAGVGYNPAITVWRPYPADNFVDGFLNPLVFPRDSQAN
jgi:hypothetical protein